MMWENQKVIVGDKENKCDGVELSLNCEGLFEFGFINCDVSYTWIFFLNYVVWNIFAESIIFWRNFGTGSEDWREGKSFIIGESLHNCRELS